MNTNSTKRFPPEDRDQVKQLTLDTSEPITLFCSMRSMIEQNTRHDLEYLPFDQAVGIQFLRFLLNRAKGLTNS